VRKKDIYKIDVLGMKSIRRAPEKRVVPMNSPVLVKNRPGRALRRPMPANGHRHPAILRHAWRAISRTLKTFAEGVAEAARRMARAYDELAAMSDPALRDSSINRSDIPAVVSGTYRRTPPPISDPTSRGRRERSPSPERRNQPCDQGVSP
jgi:uncharacterized protein YjiS (DUF1127 family)